MGTVLGLLPIVRLDDELIEGDIGRHAHHYPVKWEQQDPLNEGIVFAAHASNQVNINVEKVAKDQAKSAHVQDRAGEQDAVKLHRAKQHIEQRQGPHERVN